MLKFITIGKEAEKENSQDKYIAKTGIKSRCFSQNEVLPLVAGYEDLFAIVLNRGQNPPLGRNKAGEARVRRTNHRHTIFNGAKYGRLGVLVGRRGFSEPRVIGYIHKKVRSPPAEIPHEAGEDVLIANQNPEFCPHIFFSGARPDFKNSFFIPGAEMADKNKMPDPT